MSEVSTEVKDIKTIISDKIRDQFVELMPDETWTNMVEAEIAKFTTVVKRTGYNQTSSSPLQDMIKEEINALAKNAIKAELGSGAWQAQYIDGRQGASELVNKIVKEKASEVVSQVFGTAVQQMVDQIRFQ